MTMKIGIDFQKGSWAALNCYSVCQISKSMSAGAIIDQSHNVLSGSHNRRAEVPYRRLGGQAQIAVHRDEQKRLAMLAKPLRVLSRISTPRGSPTRSCKSGPASRSIGNALILRAESVPLPTCRQLGGRLALSTWALSTFADGGWKPYIT
jgi:hypothetical protein